LSLVVVLAPVFSNYVLYDVISIGDFFVFIAAMFLLKHIKISALGIGSIAIIFLIFLFGFYTLYESGINPGFYRIVFYYFIFFLAISVLNINFKKFFRAYIFCAMFFSISLVVQWIIYILLNISIPLQLSISYYEPDALTILDDSFRSGGWFREPSYFAIFIMPAIFYLQNQKLYLKYFIIVFAGIISTSSLVIFILLLSFFLFFGGSKQRWLWLTCMIPFLVLLNFVIFDLISDWILISRVVDIFIDGGTLNERLLPIFDIIGLSLNIAPNSVAHDLVVSGGDSGSVWYSSAAYSLASLGWFGFLFILLNFLRLGVFVAIVFFGLTLTSNVFSGAFSFFIALAFLGYKMELKKVNLEPI